MSATMLPSIPPRETPQQLKIARRLSRRKGLFDPELLKTAFRHSFVMLRPDRMWKNPVMFVVEVGTVLSIFYTILKIVNPDSTLAEFGYLIALDFWLFLTVLFANFAEALAEARGKAQADALRKTRQATAAFRLKKSDSRLPTEVNLQSANLDLESSVEETVSTDLRAGDLVVVATGMIIPGDGEIVAGVASVDESAITGESAPVIREAGGDRSGVTGGTRVLSDRIVVRITAAAGSSFLDRMIALVEGAIRQRTPNEIALSLVLSAFTLIFLIVCVALWPIARHTEQYMASYVGASDMQSLGTDIPTLVALLVCLIPTTIGACWPPSALPAWTGHSVLISSPRAAKRSKWPATLTRFYWTRPAQSPSATAKQPSLSRSIIWRRRKWVCSPHSRAPPTRRPRERASSSCIVVRRGATAPSRRRDRSSYHLVPRRA